MSGTNYGVDFGTSTSLVGVSTLFDPEIVPLGTVDPWLPSVIGLLGNDWCEGEEALLLPEQHIVRSVKRAITQNVETIDIFDGAKTVRVNADGVIRRILQMIKSAATENFLHLDEEGTVRLGCPAMWTGAQRQRLLRLAQEAGLPVGDSTLIDEPIAAGVAWANQMSRSNQSAEGKVLVFDMGGGTLDVAVLDVEVRPGRPPAISVQSAVGVDEAGDALDRNIEEDLIAKFLERGVDIDAHEEAAELRSIVRRKARDVKLELGDAHETLVVIPEAPIDLPVVEYTRFELEQAFRGQLERAMQVVERALKTAVVSQVRNATTAVSKRPSAIAALSLDDLLPQIDYVILAGGMSRVPAVREHLAKYVSADRIYSGANGDPELTIVQGLSEDASYERLNLHRPGFDFVLEWFDDAIGENRSIVIYQAYTPLYDFQQVMTTDMVKYVWRPDRMGGDLPKRGTATLRARSVAGMDIDFRMTKQGGNEDPVAVAFDFGGYAKDSVITFEPNGNVFIRDAGQRETKMRISQWPSIRGKGYEAVTAHELPRIEIPAPPVSIDRHK